MQNLIGLKLKARMTLPYCCGQIRADKIARNEVVTVDGVKYEDDGKTIRTLLFEEHADRYAADWKPEFFTPNFKGSPNHRTDYPDLED